MLPSTSDGGSRFGTQRAEAPYGLPQTQHQQPRAPVRKRAPKASTITAKMWKPCEARIRELYVHQEKSLKQLREIINREFNLNAKSVRTPERNADFTTMANVDSERQFKVKLQNMKLEKNVKAEEQRLIVKHVNQREHAGKKSNVIRVRGHEIDAQKVSRWAKDASNELLGSPSPLPSCISIHTGLSHGSQATNSPGLPQSQGHRFASFSQMDSEGTVIQRLMTYSSRSKYVIGPQEARSLFNDLQRILSSDRTSIFSGIVNVLGKQVQTWNPRAEEDITHLRNLMNSNSTPRIQIGARAALSITKTPQGGIVNNSGLKIRPRSQIHKHSSWMTAYGRVLASFLSWETDLDEQIVAIGATDRAYCAQVTIIPEKTDMSCFVTTFEFASIPTAPGLLTSLTYQCLVPNTSEVFIAVDQEDTDMLLDLLNEGRASLNDRDEQGRSLLSYAMHCGRVNVCKFLLENDADVNSIEPNSLGYMCPVYAHLSGNYYESENYLQVINNSLSKMMIEVGADILLDHGSGYNHINGFEDQLVYSSADLFKKTIDYWSPMIQINEDLISTKVSPLFIAADRSGYYYGSVGEILGKTMILLERKADITCRIANGDTVLHTVLKSRRLHEKTSAAHEWHWERLWSYKLSIFTPKDMLILFISAGADVFATNIFGETPYMVAARHGRIAEWEAALSYCGYDIEAVRAHCHSSLEKCIDEHPTCKLTFQECCQHLRARSFPPCSRDRDHLWEKVEIESPKPECIDENVKMLESYGYDFGDASDSESSIVSTICQDKDRIVVTESEDEMDQDTCSTPVLHNDIDLLTQNTDVGQEDQYFQQFDDETRERYELPDVGPVEYQFDNLSGWITTGSPLYNNHALVNDLDPPDFSDSENVRFEAREDTFRNQELDISLMDYIGNEDWTVSGANAVEEADWIGNEPDFLTGFFNFSTYGDHFNTGEVLDEDQWMDGID